MFRESDNNVPGENQVAQDKRISGEGNGAPRFLFLGNSVTLHNPLPAIGWSGRWGMAASEESRDYVHAFMAQARRKHPDAAWRIGQLADWERNFWKDEEVLKDFSALRDWRPDYILCVILGANTPQESLEAHDFGAHYRRMLRFFNPDGHARLILTDMFWRSPAKDTSIRAAAQDMNAAFVGLNDLGDNDAMMAVGLFAHNGVAHHPGDRGMQEIAARLLRAAGLA